MVNCAGLCIRHRQQSLLALVLYPLNGTCLIHGEPKLEGFSHLDRTGHVSREPMLGLPPRKPMRLLASQRVNLLWVLQEREKTGGVAARRSVIVLSEIEHSPYGCSSLES